MTAGQCRGAERRETDTQTRTEKSCKFKPRSTLWDQKGRVGQGPLEMKRDRDTEGTEAGTGQEEMERRGRDRARDGREHPESREEDGRQTQQQRHPEGRASSDRQGLK